MRHFTEEHRKNMSLAKMGKKRMPHSEESKKKISIKLLGNKNRLGSTVSNETRQKIRMAIRGTKLSSEHKEKIGKTVSQNYKDNPQIIEKISLSRLGHDVSDDTRNKIRNAISGIKRSEETKKKIGKAQIHRKPTHTNTSIEIKLQNFLKEQNIEFETQYPILGTPDIFIKPNIAIFADGCYWHKCSECGFEESIRKEREKDQRITRELQSQGYTVIRIWEHDINKNKMAILNTQHGR